MTRTSLIVVGGLVVLLLFSALGGALLWALGQRSDLLAHNARLERSQTVLLDSIAQAREARAVAGAHLDRERALRLSGDATIAEIRNLKLGECADAPLDPALADLINGMRTPR